MLKFGCKTKWPSLVDDGKASGVGHAFVDAMTEGLDRAEQEAAAVVLTGREGCLARLI